MVSAPLRGKGRCQRRRGRTPRTSPWRRITVCSSDVAESSGACAAGHPAFQRERGREEHGGRRLSRNADRVLAGRRAGVPEGAVAGCPAAANSAAAVQAFARGATCSNASTASTSCGSRKRGSSGWSLIARPNWHPLKRAAGAGGLGWVRLRLRWACAGRRTSCRTGVDHIHLAGVLAGLQVFERRVDVARGGRRRRAR